jgi:hypothetical protein
VSRICCLTNDQNNSSTDGGGVRRLMGAIFVPASASAQSISVDQARAIAKEAYIYGFPLVDSYHIQYSYFVDRGNPEFKVPWNTLSNRNHGSICCFGDWPSRDIRY